MKITEQINYQLTCVFEQSAWHGPALMELLDGVSFEKAYNKNQGAHSIWEIVNHITAWIIVVRRRAEGEAVELTDAEDWPIVPEKSEAEWLNTLEWLTKNYEELKKTISVMDDSQLEEHTAGKTYTNFFLLLGGLEHIAYHSGQLALLRK